MAKHKIEIIINEGEDGININEEYDSENILKHDIKLCLIDELGLSVESVEISEIK
jgi:hypothetical protein